MAGEPTTTRGTVLAWLFALAWAVLPACSALANGQLIGHGLTDLYTQVWGMWWLGSHFPFVPTHNELVGFPDGMSLYVQSLPKGWLSGLLLPWLGVVKTYDLLTLASRTMTIGFAFHAARAWGLKDGGALVAAAIYGASPYFQGFAVEGIAEGMDGWPLALWAWAVARDRTVWASVALALCIVAFFYLGAVACLLAVLAFPLRRKAPLSLFGVVLAAPALVVFFHTLGGGAPLPGDVRAAMGAHLSFREPGSFASFHTTANTTWMGGLTLALAIASRSWLPLFALVPFVLSFGGTPVYLLPVFSILRFPYRWHAATLAILGLAAGRTADRFSGRTAALVALAIVAEGMALSPIEPVLPGADPTVPAIYASVSGPLLELPGPLQRAPGISNPSRQRLRYILYFQTSHHQPSPWLLDLNGLTKGGPAALDFLQAWDPQSGVPTGPVPPDLVSRLRSLRVSDVMIQTAIMGKERAAPLLSGFLSQGASQVASDPERVLLRL